MWLRSSEENGWMEYHPPYSVRALSILPWELNNSRTGLGSDPYLFEKQRSNERPVSFSRELCASRQNVPLSSYVPPKWIPSLSNPGCKFPQTRCERDPSIITF